MTDRGKYDWNGYRKKYVESHPWARHYYSSKGRAKKLNRDHNMRMQDFKDLWLRDKAWLLKAPSIDRIDNKIGYIKTNCRFIERSENSRLGVLGRKVTLKQRFTSRKNILKWTIKNTKITLDQVKEIKASKGITQMDLAKKYNVSQSLISRIKNNKRRIYEN